MKDQVIVTFLEDLLVNCKRARNLIMSRYESIEWTLKALRRVLSKLTSIYVWSTLRHGFCTMPERETLHTGDCMEITLHGSTKIKRAHDGLLNAITTFSKKISLTLVFDTESETDVDLSQFLHKDLERLRIICKVLSRITVVKEAIPPCPSLTHLSLLGTGLCHSALAGLSDSAGCCLLPKLQYLSSAFSNINCSVVPTWKTLTSLDWNETLANFDAISKLPNLESLFIPALYIRSSCQSVIRQTLSQLTCLAVFDLTRKEYTVLMEMVGAGSLEKLKSLSVSPDSASVWSPVISQKSWNRPPIEHLAFIAFINLPLPNLSLFVLYKLDISHSKGISGSLSALLWRDFPSLHTLIVRDCELILQDLCALIQSRAEGNLPKLRTLDVSHNFHFFAIMDSFEHEEPSVQCCHHMTSAQQFSDDQSESLNYLQELSISVDWEDELIISTHWPRLEQLSIDCIGYMNTENEIRTIAKAYEKRLLPSLQRVLLFVYRNQIPSLETERLKKHGILPTVMKMEDRKFLQRAER